MIDGRFRPIKVGFELCGIGFPPGHLSTHLNNGLFKTLDLALVLSVELNCFVANLSEVQLLPSVICLELVKDMFELGKFCLKVLDLSFELVIHVLSFLDFRLHFGNYLLVTLNLNPGLLVRISGFVSDGC